MNSKAGRIKRHGSARERSVFPETRSKTFLRGARLREETQKERGKKPLLFVDSDAIDSSRRLQIFRSFVRQMALSNVIPSAVFRAATKVKSAGKRQKKANRSTMSLEAISASHLSDIPMLSLTRSPSIFALERASITALALVKNGAQSTRGEGVQRARMRAHVPKCTASVAMAKHGSSGGDIKGKLTRAPAHVHTHQNFSRQPSHLSRTITDETGQQLQFRRSECTQLFQFHLQLLATAPQVFCPLQPPTSVT